MAHVHSSGRGDIANDEVVRRLPNSPLPVVNVPNFTLDVLVDSGSSRDLIHSGSDRGSLLSVSEMNDTDSGRSELLVRGLK